MIRGDVFFAVAHVHKARIVGGNFIGLPICCAALGMPSKLPGQAMSVLAGWIAENGRTEPRGIEALRAEVAQDLSDGAFVPGIPFDRPATRATA